MDAEVELVDLEASPSTAERGGAAEIGAGKLTSSLNFF
jgi:hypothetical protein